MPLSSESLDSSESQHNPKPTASPDASTAALQTRRSLREAQLALTASAPVTPASPSLQAAARTAAAPAVRSAAKPPVSVAPAVTAKSRFTPTKRGVISTVVMTAAAALIATMALPAYAFSTDGAFDPSASTQSILSGQQTLAVDATAADNTVSRDDYKAPTKDDLAAVAAKAAADAAAAKAAAAALAVAQVSSTSSTSAASNSSIVVNPPSGPYSGAAVVAFAQQFVGVVPYGSGASPDTSFGCDGLTQYVFKQFGINLPRTVSAQAAMGTRISAADAQPGDLMVYSIGHIGIYAGGGTMIDSPDWGRLVEHRPVWGSYYFVRLGI